MPGPSQKAILRQQQVAASQRAALEKINRERGGGGASYWTDDLTAQIWGKRGDPKKVIVTGLSEDTSPAEFHSYFKKYGEVASIFLPREHFGGPCIGVGVVVYGFPEGLDKLEAAQPHTLKGRVLEITRDVPKKTSAQKKRKRR